MDRLNLPFLLVLPTPPSSISPTTLKTAYHPAITATLTKLASLKLPKPALLEVAVPFPGKYKLDEPRSHLFKDAERLFAGLYSLICIVCAEKSIEPESAGGVDARLIFITQDDLDTPRTNTVSSSPQLSASGPIVDMQTFALTRRNWDSIFCADGELGQEPLNRYMELASRTNPPVQSQIYIVQGGINLVSAGKAESQTNKGSSQIHTTVAVGGTFDHLHAGHKLLLSATALLLQPSIDSAKPQRRLVIGITGDELLKNKKYAAYLQSWKQRQEDVVDFLLTILSFTRLPKEELEYLSFDEPTVNGRAIHTRLKQAGITIECVEIQDPFGPTVTDETISALVVSGETRSGGAAVNAKREEKGWKPLEVFEVDVLDAQEEKQSGNGSEEFAAKISSTAIRKRKAEIARGPSL